MKMDYINAFALTSNKVICGGYKMIKVWDLQTKKENLKSVE